MKKVSVIFLTICLFLTGCNLIKTTTRENKPIVPRTTDISSGIKDEGNSFSYSFDLDFDGEDENITMEIEWNEVDDWESKLLVTAGDYNKELPMMGGIISAVYACDIDTKDNVLDIAIITTEVSDDPRLRILKYDEDFTQYTFSFDDIEGIQDELWIGYAITQYFKVNDDDTITVEEQTPSYGMWSVYKTYARNSDGIFEELVPKYYEILPDFMERGMYRESFDKYELEMWKKGYIKAYSDYDDGTLVIKTDEYVKPLYDDGKNKIYLEKENGENGWMNMDYADGYNPGNFNPFFFFLAG